MYTQVHKNLRLLSSLTYPPSFTLILECLLGILCGGLDIVHCMFYVILDTIYHFPLQWTDPAKKERENKTGQTLTVSQKKSNQNSSYAPMLKKKAKYHAILPYDCVQTDMKALKKSKSECIKTTVHKYKVAVNQW